MITASGRLVRRRADVGRSNGRSNVSDVLLNVRRVEVTETEVGVVIVDCDGCVVRGLACGECVVSVVLGAPPAGVELDDDVRLALQVLAEGGLVPQLRLLPRAVGE